ncbi:hypothetical protein NDU88_000577 [Pleurodeles waltl]|uniref:Secreted protein n=1 Tax=Pleurodeles waltl TaxID=8319 RepID=A0AAV7V9D8_PLEWA|nr:hypothetical protein NDU88_000577 [Pleurodeles waltl]
MLCIVRRLVLGRSVTSCFSSKKSFRVTRPRDSSYFGSIAHGRRLHVRLFFFRHRVRTCSFSLRVSGRKVSQNQRKICRYCFVRYRVRLESTPNLEELR